MSAKAGAKLETVRCALFVFCHKVCGKNIKLNSMKPGGKCGIWAGGKSQFNCGADQDPPFKTEKQKAFGFGG